MDRAAKLECHVFSEVARNLRVAYGRVKAGQLVR
jgi:hypothetical protein